MLYVVFIGDSASLSCLDGQLSNGHKLCCYYKYVIMI
jgi:hypothetical protein